MSTSISTVIDMLFTQANTAFSSKNIIPNPYELESNPIILMRDSYGFRFDEVAQGSLDWTHTTTTGYSVGFILSRELVKVEGSYTAPKTLIKNLYEDELTFRKVMLKSNQLTLGDDIQKITWNSIDALSTTENNKIAYIISNYIIDIAEEIETC